ncbi:hypothetical protein BSKO_11252 [Bryopsis sp. KO-2023]|nr:hypothetical protein BSKO_11252 [Bryopsis sp. KO-2023]
MWKLFWWCLAFRVFNALVVRTYFDPDEFWQGSEVAHKIAFGYGHLTWEWAAGLRSILYPMMLSLAYWPLKIFSLDAPWAVAFAPRLLQSIFAALSDVHVHGVSKKIFGKETARFALLCQLACWFNFYCSVRTFSNSMEACLTIVAFYHWPSLTSKYDGTSNAPRSDWGRPLAIFVAGCCVVMRPTSAMLWIPIGLLEIFRSRKRLQFVIEVISLAVVVVGASLAADRWFYERFVFPPWQFFKINQVDGVAVLYGSHPWHWYFTQGLPAMLGPLIFIFPFAVWWASGKREIAGWAMWYLLCHSFIGHKEFRYVYPAVLLCMPFCGYALQKLQPASKKGGKKDDDFASGVSRISKEKTPKSAVWKAAVFVVIGLQIPFMVFFSVFHQRGTISAVDYLGGLPDGELQSVLFLLPCHSMPLYSYLHKKNVPMRFLDCSPPGWARSVAEMNLDLGTTQHPELVPPCTPQSCVSESDVFRSNSRAWLEGYFSQNATPPSHIVGCDSTLSKSWAVLEQKAFQTAATFFNSHFDLYGWECNNVIVLAK